MSALLDDRAWDRHLDAQDARMDAAEARAKADRKDWLAGLHSELLQEFAEANAQAWAAFQEQQWLDYCEEQRS